MATPSHVSLNDRKTLFGRLVYFESFQPLLSEVYTENAVEDFKLFRNSLFQELQTYVDGPGRDVPFDQLVNDVLTRFQPPSQVSTSYPVISNKLLSGIQTKAAQVTCLGCTSPKAVICNGSDADNQLVADNGLCLLPLHNIFKLASEVARTYFDTFGTLHHPNPLPDIIFSTGLRASNTALEFHTKYCVTAVVDYPDAGQSAQVTMTVEPDRFNRKSYLAALYVIFRAAISEAFNDIFPVSAQREAALEFDAFVKGWMDLVSLEVIEEMFRGQGPAAPLLSKVAWPHDNLSKARDYHAARTDPSHPESSQYARQRFPGVTAARKLLKFLEERPGSHKPPRESFYQLSFDLSMLRYFDKGRRRAFIIMLNKLPENGKPLLYLENRVAYHVSKYLTTGNLQELVDQLYNLLT